MVSDCRWVVLPVGHGHAVFSQLPLLGPGRKAVCWIDYQPVARTKPHLGKNSLSDSAFAPPCRPCEAGHQWPARCSSHLGEVLPSCFYSDAFWVRGKAPARPNPPHPRPIVERQRSNSVPQPSIVAQGAVFGNGNSAEIGASPVPSVGTTNRNSPKSLQII